MLLLSGGGEWRRARRGAGRRWWSMTARACLGRGKAQGAEWHGWYADGVRRGGLEFMSTFS